MNMKRFFCCVLLLALLISFSGLFGKVQAAILGDIDGNSLVTDADAIYLLRYTLFPSQYPINANADYNRDGKTTDADAIYLLRHTLFPSAYPLDSTQPITTKPVETVIDYSRKIVPQGGSTYLTHHTVRCPALTATSADALAINREIYANCSKAVEILKNYKEEDYIFMYDYYVAAHDGIVAVIMEYALSNHYGGVFADYAVYYFDTNTGKQLTFDQYMKVLKIDPQAMVWAIDTSGLYLTENYTIHWAATDETHTYIFIESPDVLDGFFLLKRDVSILSS